ncbi:nuclear pore complex protein NUP133 [Ananas comosus]|uniref:Nuclear pore complex protein NUP133 n=1 Tax=Ananas comosus TaxID=4615 RepID=A0A6P5G2Y4_ANACO|nr:nuclear pore complex protein NUP133 [Ananas comosus]
MFSPATRKPHLASPQRGKENKEKGHDESPSTPLPLPLPLPLPSIPNRPLTGTPAPWSSRLSVLARIPTGKKADKSDDSNQIQPVFVGDFPHIVRNAQSNLLQKNFTDSTAIAGGMDKGTSLAWMVCGSELFIWSYLSASVSKDCIVLEVPLAVIGNNDLHSEPLFSNHLMVCMVRWDIPSSTSCNIMLEQSSSTGVILFNQTTQVVAYWHDIYSERGRIPIISFPALNNNDGGSSDDRTNAVNRNHKDGCIGHEHSSEKKFNSIIADAVPDSPYECIAIACQSYGALWLFRFKPTEIHRRQLSEVLFGSTSTRHSQSDKGYARSLIWQSKHSFAEKSDRNFLLLTNREIQCWNIMLAPNLEVTKLWAHEIVGNDGDLGIKKDLAGQKHIWLLDMQTDDHGRDLSILVATFCKDRVSSSSYTQYSLLTMQYNPGQHFSSKHNGSKSERFLEKKAPLQVIIPKARVEDEDFLFAMRLRIGGKPSGSAIVLSGDGTATVTNYWRGSTRLYQFDLPWDAGKVLDASVFPSAEDNEEGAWIVLTERAGFWAIHEKAVLLGGVEPPERSLSRKGSSNEGVAEEEKRSQAFGGNVVPRRASSEAWSGGGRQRAAFSGIAQRTALDEEVEALLGRLFHDFVLSSAVDGVFEKLQMKGAFEKEGETNVFVRMSKSIVDTLAKHWTTTRGSDFVASAVVSSLLLDKQQKHQKYLQFLALSKCHAELYSKQRIALLTILENGEKLSGMIQLRELQNVLSQQRLGTANSSSSQSYIHTAGSLWSLIQLVGEKARRNTVLLMDRDNAEVFYSKVSDIEEFFYCLSHYLQYIINGESSFFIRMEQAFELANACTLLIQSAMRYRDEHKNWYPSPEGLTPWNSQPVVRSGLWSIAAFIMQLLKESGEVDISGKSKLWSQFQGLTATLLDAYTGSISAKIERGEERKGLLEEYCRRREELLGSMYEFAKRIVEAKYQESCKGVDDNETKESIYREVTSPILLIAKQHEGYQTLWHICYDLGDTELLRNLMHVGPHGGFSYYVFQQLIKNQQYAKLLRLGEEFLDELANFLKDHKDLRWLHEIFLSQFSSASETLHALSLFGGDDSALVSKENFDLTEVKRLPSLAERRRLLNVSKISAMAGKDVGFEMKIARIEADLQILKLQEEIVAYFVNIGEEDISKPLTPTELIDMCLRGGRDISLKVFDVFAWTSASFRRSNVSTLEECWMNAANQDDWLSICQASTVEGWSEEVLLEALRETVLFNASSRCYGSGADMMYDGSFEEILPLRKEHVQLSSLTLHSTSSSSVEEILMKHKDFPDAGKLMLTAVFMGKEGSNVVAVAEEADIIHDDT